MLKKLKHVWHKFWPTLRELTGDDAYERYLKHHAEFHKTSVDASPALTRKAFFILMQDKKWQGVNRCC